VVKEADRGRHLDAIKAAAIQNEQPLSRCFLTMRDSAPPRNSVLFQ
jgi:hypothetical protein